MAIHPESASECIARPHSHHRCWYGWVARARLYSTFVANFTKPLQNSRNHSCKLRAATAQGVSEFSRSLQDAARIASNSQASSAERDDFDYEEHSFLMSRHVEDVCLGGESQVRSEFTSCKSPEDVLEVLVEEAEQMTGGLLVDGLIRCIRLAKNTGKAEGRSAQRQSLSAVSRSDAFQALLAFVVDTAPEMTAKELALCVWSLATMKVKVIRVLRALQKQIELRLAELNEQDLALTAWAFATLRHHPGGLLDQLAGAAVPKLFGFQPQGLSIMLWAFAKLGHTPPPELSGRVLMRFNEDPENFSSQSVANIMYALGKLQKYPKSSTCRRVEQLIAQQPERYKDIELANILFSYTKAKYAPTELIRLLEDRIAGKRLDEHTKNVVWASLIWAAGTLSLQLQPTTWAALNAWGLDDLSSFQTVSICNIAWGMAMMEEVQHPAFARAVAAVVRSHEARPLEPRLMRQLFQAVTAARILGVEVPVPAELEGLAYKWWRKGTLGIPVSLAHESAAKAVRTLGIECTVQHNPGYGLPLVDIAITLPQYKLALQMVAPGAHTINTGQHIGKIRHAQKMLETAGWRVENLEVSQLPIASNRPAVVRFMGKLLRKHGIAMDWERAAASVPEPVPSAFSRGTKRGLSSVLGLSDQRARVTGMTGAEENNIIARKVPVQDSNLPEPSRTRQSRHTTEPATQQKRGSQGSAIDVTRTAASNALTQALQLPEEETLSPEELEKKAAERRRRRSEVAKGLSGDFMAGWVGLSEWKAARRVEPGKQ